METTPESTQDLKPTAVKGLTTSSSVLSRMSSSLNRSGMKSMKTRQTVMASTTLAALNDSKKPWNRQALFALFFVFLATVLGAITNWWIMTRIGQDSLGNLAGQLQQALGKQFDEATNAFFVPAKVMLRQGYEMAYQEGWDLTTRQGQMNMVGYRAAFLETWLTDSRCCSGIFTNMVYHGFDENGQPNDLFGIANENHFDSDLAQFSTVVSKPGKVVARYGLYPGGNRTNPMIEESFDMVTGRAKDADRFPVGDLAGRKNLGFKHFPKNNLFFRVQFEKNLQEGEMAFADLEYVQQLSTIQITGVVPIYHPSCGSSPTRKKNGTCFGQVQKRVGVMVVGVRLGRLSKYLSEMNLKGGLVFFVERKTGYFAGGSNLGMTLNRTETINGKKVDKPVLAAEAEDKKIRDRVQWLLEERDGRRISWADVTPGVTEAGIGDEGDQFLYVSEYKEFGLDWVIVASIPWKNVMEDIESSKYRMLLIGMALALLFKGLVQMVAKGLNNYFNRNIVLPSIKSAVEADIEKNLRTIGKEVDIVQNGYPLQIVYL